MSRRFRALFLVWVLAGSVGRAETGRSAAPLLTMPGEAKGAAFGEAYGAVAEGANGLWYNPAAIGRKRSPTISLMHTAYVEDITYNTFGFAVPFGERNAVGLGIAHL